MGKNEAEFRSCVDKALRCSVPGCTGLAGGEQVIKQLSGGASASLYQVRARRADGTELKVCLRREQHSNGLNSAVGMESQVQLMRAARKEGAPVPEILGTPDPEILGPAFFMAWVDGEGRGDRLAKAPDFDRLRDSGDLGRQCGKALARIHAVDTQALQRSMPGGIAHPAERLRQVRQTYLALRMDRCALDFALSWLAAHIPAEMSHGSPVLVHGDFRGGNILAHPTEGVVGVVDWELAHIGSRYEDVGWLCVRSWRHGRLDRAVGGFANLLDFCKGYEEAGGGQLDAQAVEWWTLLGSVMWALICLQQGLAFRADQTRLENGVVGRRTSEAELDCLWTIAEINKNVELALARAHTASSMPNRRADASLTELPSDFELLWGVHHHLISQAQALAAGGEVRSGYLSRVAATAVAIVARGLEGRDDAAEQESESLRKFTGSGFVSTSATGSAPSAVHIAALRSHLSARLRSGDLPVDTPGLLGSLLRCTMREVEVDQPKYASLVALRSAL